MDTLIEIGIELALEGAELLLEFLFDPAYRTKRKKNKETETE